MPRKLLAKYADRHAPASTTPKPNTACNRIALRSDLGKKRLHPRMHLARGFSARRPELAATLRSGPPERVPPVARENPPLGQAFPLTPVPFHQPIVENGLKAQDRKSTR